MHGRATPCRSLRICSLVCSPAVAANRPSRSWWRSGRRRKRWRRTSFSPTRASTPPSSSGTSSTGPDEVVGHSSDRGLPHQSIAGLGGNRSCRAPRRGGRSPSRPPRAARSPGCALGSSICFHWAVARNSGLLAPTISCSDLSVMEPVEAVGALLGEVVGEDLPTGEVDLALQRLGHLHR